MELVKCVGCFSLYPISTSPSGCAPLFRAKLCEESHGVQLVLKYYFYPFNASEAANIL